MKWKHFINLHAIQLDILCSNRQNSDLFNSCIWNFSKLLPKSWKIGNKLKIRISKEFMNANGLLVHNQFHTFKMLFNTLEPIENTKFDWWRMPSNPYERYVFIFIFVYTIHTTRSTICEARFEKHWRLLRLV